MPGFKTFAAATEALTKEDAPTVSQVFFLVHTLLSVACKSDGDDSPVARHLKGSQERIDLPF